MKVTIALRRKPREQVGVGFGHFFFPQPTASVRRVGILNKLILSGGHGPEFRVRSSGFIQFLRVVLRVVISTPDGGSLHKFMIQSRRRVPDVALASEFPMLQMAMCLRARSQYDP